MEGSLQLEEKESGDRVIAKRRERYQVDRENRCARGPLDGCLRPEWFLVFAITGSPDHPISSPGLGFQKRNLMPIFANGSSFSDHRISRSPDHPIFSADWVGFSWFSFWTLINAVLAIGVSRRAPLVALFLAPTFAHEALIAVAFLARRPLLKQAEGWSPRLAAYVATFLIPAFCFFASQWRPGWMKPSSPAAFATGVVLWNVGAYVGLWSLLRLRRAFSIVPQARMLVTDGPYRIVRHPVYASYLFQYAGVVLSHLNPAMGAAFVIWLVAVLVRVSYEEGVLEAAFPEYKDYRRRVGRFAPHPFRRAALPAIVPVRVGSYSASDDPAVAVITKA